MTWPNILASAQRGIANWRLGVLWIVATLIPAAIISLPVGGILSAALDHSVFAGEWAKESNLIVIVELISNSTDLAPALASSAVVAALVTVLLWPFLTAMIVSTAADTAPAGFGTLLRGGVHAYGRMLRMLLWSLIPFGIACGIGGAAMHLAQHLGEKAVLLSTSEHQHAAAMIFLVALLVLAHITVEAGRAQFALDSSRRSAVKAWWRGLKVIKSRPMAMFASYLALTLTGFAVMAVIGVIRINLPRSNLFGIIVALGFTQLIVIAAVWMRTSRLLAMIRIGSSTVPR
jgi:hypothetical protein